MSTIQFAPSAPTDPPGARDRRRSAGGVFSTRPYSRSQDRASFGNNGTNLNGEDGAESVGSDGVDLKHDGDIKEKQEFKGWLLVWLAYQSTGVIYGDIGTSPLYVYSSTFSADPSYDDLLGALSLIIYSLTIMVTVKYIVIVLNADDEGEGGTFALFSLLSRYINIVDRGPRELSMVRLQRHKTDDLTKPTNSLRAVMENSNFVKGLLKFIGVLGVSLVIADGVLTPAQSVLGAIQGLNVVVPDISTGTVVGVSCGILVLLFLVQPLGTSKLASSFAPIIIIWLGFNAGFGIYNLILFDHTVFKAFSPYFAGAYLVRNGQDGWKSLGGILLAFTGCEALFADLGAFSKHSIQLGWLTFSYPCLLLAYVGQAAYISVNPDAYANPFFNCVPPGMFYPSLVMAILAAIVASQALITATFQLLTQVMKLSYFPQLKVIHTSDKFHGQIYLPVPNYLLMVGTVIVTAVYNNTTSLGNAYGVCVILVTFITTCMVSLVALFKWRINPIIVACVFMVFAAFDGAFLSAALTKIPTGAWFTLVLAFVLYSIFVLWRYGKEQQWAAEATDRLLPSRLVSQDNDGKMTLTEAYGGKSITEINGFALFFDKIGDMTPTVFIHFLSKLNARPEIIVFFHLRPLTTPSVAVEDRYTVSYTSIPNCYRVTIRHGYTDEVISQDLSLLVYEHVRDFIIHSGARPRHIAAPPTGDKEFSNEKADGSSSSQGNHIEEASPSAQQPTSASAVKDITGKLTALSAAHETQVLYIVGKEQMRIRDGTGYLRRIALTMFLWIRENTRSKMASLKIPTEQLVEIGFVKEI